MDWYFNQTQQLKRLNDGFVSYKNTAFHSIRCGLLVDRDVFISCLNYDSDGIHSLSDKKLNFFKDVTSRNCHSTFSAYFHFWVNYSFKNSDWPVISAFSKHEERRSLAYTIAAGYISQRSLSYLTDKK